MLKRLFISLLILSTLISEGTASLPEVINKLNLTLGNAVNLLEQGNIEKASLIDTGKTAQAVFTPVESHAFLLSADSMSLFKLKVHRNIENIRLEFKSHLEIYHVYCFPVSSIPSNKDIIISKADNSPPYLFTL